MKATAVVLVTLFLGAGVAEAGWWPTKKLPKPVDTPYLRPKLKESHKPANRAKHPPAYNARLATTTPATA